MWKLTEDEIVEVQELLRESHMPDQKRDQEHEYPSLDSESLLPEFSHRP